MAATNATVLLLGETGTGKEMIASAIHEMSSRSKRAMVRVNCGAIPTALVESEMFGREKGAYTQLFPVKLAYLNLQILPRFSSMRLQNFRWKSRKAVACIARKRD